MRRAPFELLLACACVFAGCTRTGADRDNDTPLAAASASQAGAGSLPSRESPASSAPVPSSPTDKAAARMTWHGSYRSVAGTVTIPESLKAGSWANGDTTEALGEGTLSLAVDPASNRVTGSIEGPLGPASLAGLRSGNRITATIRRMDPADQGFTGILEATESGRELKGTIQGALGLANAVRTAALILSGDAPSPNTTR